MTLLSKGVCLGCLCLFLSRLAADPVTLHICTDINAWYPFTYTENGDSRGLHVDIVKLACQELGLRCEFEPLPWKRCLLSVKAGQKDGVVSASYNRERAQYAHYPSGADSDPKSPWRISQAEYVVVTRSDSDYEFTGDLSTLPQPVSAPLGYAIIVDLQRAGLKVSEYSKNSAMFKTLLDTKTSTVVTLSPIPELLEKGAEFRNKVKIHAKPVTSKSYYLAISKKAALNDSERILLWKTIVSIREDKQRFSQLLQQY